MYKILLEDYFSKTGFMDGDDEDLVTMAEAMRLTFVRVLDKTLNSPKARRNLSQLLGYDVAVTVRRVDVDTCHNPVRVAVFVYDRKTRGERFWLDCRPWQEDLPQWLKEALERMYEKYFSEHPKWGQVVTNVWYDYMFPRRS